MALRASGGVSEALASACVVGMLCGVVILARCKIGVWFAGSCPFWAQNWKIPSGEGRERGFPSGLTPLRLLNLRLHAAGLRVFSRVLSIALVVLLFAGAAAALYGRDASPAGWPSSTAASSPTINFPVGWHAAAVAHRDSGI